MFELDSSLRDRSFRLLFISAHGYGHITRMRHVLMEMEKRIPEEDRILLFCDTDPRFFDPRDFPKTIQIRLRHDVGLVQTDSFTMDYPKTFRALENLKRRRNALRDSLLEAIDSIRPLAVLSDTSPLGISVAKHLGIPGFVIGNFTWSDIYGDLAVEHSAFEEHARDMDSLYLQADACWRLPLHTEMRPFPSCRIEEIPWIVPRPSRMNMNEWERKTGIPYPRDRKVVLCSFGGFDFHNLPVDKIESLSDEYLFITTRAGGARKPRNLIQIDAMCVDYLGLVKHADLVITKPGYGILSECLVHRKPIVYCDRGRFAEYDILASWLDLNYPSVYLPRARLANGEWREAMEEALKIGRDFPEVNTGGALKTACLLEEKVESAKRRVG